MKHLITAAALVLGTAGAGLAQDGFERAADNPLTLDFSGVQSDLAGGPNQVLVLGTPHINGVPSDVLPLSDLSLLLDRLEAFAPDIIAIEAADGMTCHLLSEYPDQFEGVYQRYCPDPSPALDSLGLDRLGAVAALNERLASWPQTPTPADHRHLAALLYATGDTNSAALHWLELDAEERVAADGVSDALASVLDERITYRNELVSLGAVLGARLDHVRLHAMDDRIANRVYARSRPGGGAVMQSIWAENIDGFDEATAEAEALLGSPEGVLAYYRAVNASDYHRRLVANDFGPAATTTENDNISRHYLAWWQSRGLRMAANIVDAASVTPGARILVIVGYSHKAYVEAYLDPMHDFQIIPLDSVLAD
ncbi:DUF5694 domain-containing protein [Maricaulis sp.]|uniref:DUF5694 domain-containing protein n=1 Tax=Maricaulis sp. TaxID=1486257 RepID=UPI00260D1A7F|nr:DUF5694 domain-containing protein [Maricaulis sp.]